MENNVLTDLEEKFCLVYACGPAPYNGNAQKTYDLVFKDKVVKQKSKNDESGDDNEEADENDRVESTLWGRNLLKRPEIKERIQQIQSENDVAAATLRPRLTEILLKIADECSTSVFQDRWGVDMSPAALRSVAVNALSKVADMYGIKEDIAHKVMLEGADGEGITFNLIMPDNNKENELSEIF